MKNQNQFYLLTMEVELTYDRDDTNLEFSDISALTNDFNNRLTEEFIGVIRAGLVNQCVFNFDEKSDSGLYDITFPVQIHTRDANAAEVSEIKTAVFDFFAGARGGLVCGKVNKVQCVLAEQQSQIHLPG